MLPEEALATANLLTHCYRVLMLDRPATTDRATATDQNECDDHSVQDLMDFSDHQHSSTSRTLHNTTDQDGDPQPRKTQRDRYGLWCGKETPIIPTTPMEIPNALLEKYFVNVSRRPKAQRPMELPLPMPLYHDRRPFLLAIATQRDADIAAQRAAKAAALARDAERSQRAADETLVKGKERATAAKRPATQPLMNITFPSKLRAVYKAKSSTSSTIAHRINAIPMSPSPPHQRPSRSAHRSTTTWSRHSSTIRPASSTPPRHHHDRDQRFRAQRLARQLEEDNHHRQRERTMPRTPPSAAEGRAPPASPSPPAVSSVIVRQPTPETPPTACVRRRQLHEDAASKRKE